MKNENFGSGTDNVQNPQRTRCSFCCRTCSVFARPSCCALQRNLGSARKRFLAAHPKSEVKSFALSVREARHPPCCASCTKVIHVILVERPASPGITSLLHFDFPALRLNTAGIPKNPPNSWRSADIQLWLSHESCRKPHLEGRTTSALTENWGALPLLRSLWTQVSIQSPQFAQNARSP